VNRTNGQAEPLDAYLAQLVTIPGWLTPVDFRMIRDLAGLQTRRGITGDLFEIGAYCGKTAIELGYLRQPTESLVVCDLFESEEVPAADQAEVAYWYGDLSRGRFEAIYLRYHPELPQILQMPSTEIGNQQLGSRFRFIHIDGSHVYQTVKSDIALAKELSCPQAILAFDDYGSPHCPGIPAAVWEAHFDLGLEPFLLTDTKLYAHWGDYGADLLDEMETRGRVEGLVCERHDIMGRQVLRVIEDTHRWTVRKVVSLTTPPGLEVAAWKLRRAVAMRNATRQATARRRGARP